MFAFWFSLVGNAIMAAYTAWRYAAFALDPARVGDAESFALALLAIIAFAGPQPELARARIDAITHDAVNLLIMTPLAGRLGVGLALAAKDLLAWKADLGLTGIAWIGAAYFACVHGARCTRSRLRSRRGARDSSSARGSKKLVTPAPKGEP